MSTALLLVIAAGGLAILYGAFTVQQVMSLPTGSDRMREIASAIQEGAQAYLNRQYTTILIAGVVVFAILLFALGIVQALGFAAGAFLSGAAGYIGMLVSVRANVRTTQAASESLGKGLSVAFRSGAVTGLLVAGLALIGLAGYYAILTGPLGCFADLRQTRLALGDLPSRVTQRFVAGVQFDLFGPGLFHLRVEGNDFERRSLVPENQGVAAQVPNEVIGDVTAQDNRLRDRYLLG